MSSSSSPEEFDIQKYEKELLERYMKEDALNREEIRKMEESFAKRKVKDDNGPVISEAERRRREVLQAATDFENRLRLDRQKN